MATQKPIFDDYSQYLETPGFSWPKSTPARLQPLNHQNQVQAIQDLWQLDDNHNTMRFSTTNTLGISTNTTLHYQAPQMDWVSDLGELIWECTQGNLSGHSQEIQFQCEDQTITISNNEIHCNVKQITIVCNGVKHPSSITCQQQQHSCPQVTAANTPHVGGVIIEGSNNVTFHQQGISRQGDRCLCQGASNALQEGISGLTINGRPAAYLGGMTQHGGVVNSGIETIQLHPFQRHEQEQIATTESSSLMRVSLTNYNSAENVNIENRHVTLHTEHFSRRSAIHHQQVVFTELNGELITSWFSFRID